MEQINVKVLAQPEKQQIGTPYLSRKSPKTPRKHFVLQNDIGLDIGFR